MMIFIAIIVYILSVIGMWQYMRIAHSPTGRWYNLTPTMGCVMWVIVPFFNTLACTGWLTNYPVAEKWRKQKVYNTSWFFKIKK